MANLDLPRTRSGHMCTLGGTDEPLKMCPSCQRAVVYGVLLWGAGCGALDESRKALAGMDFIEAGMQLMKAQEMTKAIIRALVEVVKTDFASMCNLVEAMSDEAYALALQAFLHERTTHYTDPETGRIIFEPHDEMDEDDGDGDGVDRVVTTSKRPRHSAGGLFVVGATIEACPRPAPECSRRSL